MKVEAAFVSNSQTDNIRFGMSSTEFFYSFGYGAEQITLIELQIIFVDLEHIFDLRTKSQEPRFKTWNLGPLVISNW